MQNSYSYVDPDYVYTDPDTGVLRNIGDITDHDSLVFAETAATTKRANELRANLISTSTSEALFAIHRHLFQDIYTWAGKHRVVEISKAGKQFFPLSHFDNAIKYIDDLLTEYHVIDCGDKDKLASKLAEILDAVNYLHPFREGNGRTQREFVRTLALAKGWILNLNPPDNAGIYEKYMSGTINGDVNLLTDLIRDCMIR